eukprot:EG_transcript_10787
MYSSLNGTTGDAYANTYVTRVSPGPATFVPGPSTFVPEPLWSGQPYRTPLSQSLVPSGSRPAYSLSPSTSLRPAYRPVSHGPYGDPYGPPAELPFARDGWGYPAPATVPAAGLAPAPPGVPTKVASTGPAREVEVLRYPYPPPTRPYRPANAMAVEVAKRLQPYLGLAVVWGNDPREALRKACLVDKVLAGSAAEKAGLLVGDHIDSWDGAPLKSESDWKRVVDALQVGQFARVRVIRNGLGHTTVLHVAGAEEAAAAAPGTKLRPQLGIAVRWENGACLVNKVLPNSAAEKAGLLVDDHLESWDGTPLKSDQDWKQLVSPIEVGQVVQLGVARRGQKHTAAVTIGGVGEAAPAGKLRPQLGMAVQWGDDPRGGRKNACKVIKVLPGSSADKAGIVVGDHIETWDGMPLEDEQDWKKAVGGMRMGQIVRLRIVRDNFFHVTYVHIEGVEDTGPQVVMVPNPDKK